MGACKNMGIACEVAEGVRRKVAAHWRMGHEIRRSNGTKCEPETGNTVFLRLCPSLTSPVFRHWTMSVLARQLKRQKCFLGKSVKGCSVSVYPDMPPPAASGLLHPVFACVNPRLPSGRGNNTEHQRNFPPQ